MSRFKSTEPIPFELPGGCLCKGSPHEADIVYFAPHLSVEAGIEANRVIQTAREQGVSKFTTWLEREMGWVVTVHGVVGWNLLDDDGKPVPVTEGAIRSLGWEETTQYLVGKADELYGEEAFAPFQKRLSSYLAQRQTGAPTSPTPSSNGTRSPRSKRSSRPTSVGTTPSTA